MRAAPVVTLTGEQRAILQTCARAAVAQFASSNGRGSFCRPPAASTPEKAREVAVKTTQTQPVQATYWSCRTMTRATGLSEVSVRRSWKTHGLRPHQLTDFKLSNDPQFLEKLEDTAGLYLNPPEHAVVFSLDE